MADIGNSQMDRHNARAAEFARRIVTPGAPGSAGDLMDRTRDWYKPNANPVPPQPLDSLIVKGARAAKAIAGAVSKAMTPRSKTAPKP